jgi:hypothetical protein
MGIFKERLSQSALYYAMTQVSDEEAREVRRWLDLRGVRFRVGADAENELTDAQVHQQCKMYIAALRIADDFGCDAIGIQYQQGLKDLVPASDLVEGLLNNCERPPVTSRDGSRVLYDDKALPHFNEVDECAGVDALVTNRVWTALAVPPRHLSGGFRGAECVRQPRMSFRLGGASIRGISKPGEVVWSRVFVEGNRLKVDLGRAVAVELPKEESERRWQLTNWEWPMMHAVLSGVTRDQMMARHKSNHVQVAYAPDAVAADRALAAKAATFARLGMDVSICGTVAGLEEGMAMLTSNQAV